MLGMRDSLWSQHTADTVHTLRLRSHDRPYLYELNVTSVPNIAANNLQED